jgi:hypothetical protein
MQLHLPLQAAAVGVAAWNLPRMCAEVRAAGALRCCCQVVCPLYARQGRGGRVSVEAPE